jgi:transposase
MAVSDFPGGAATTMWQGRLVVDVIVERGCGLDVHQAMVVACLLTGPPGKRPTKEIRTFRTLTAALREMRDWLREQGCTHVAMESTGIYWQPVYAVLDGHFELVVGNAHHIKNVPGRKTDVKDSEWIANLLRHGLIRSSFVPAKPVRELRDLLRYRRKLVDAGAAERNRLLKLLETANIKLSSVASDVFGVSGMAMLRALIAGTATPAEMAALARGRLRHKLAELELALEGCVEDHHRYLLGMQLRRIEAIEHDLGELDTRITAKLEPYGEQHRRLTQIPGVDWFVAAVMVAELGVDMTVFASAAHAAAWGGMCPGNYESAGKRHGGKLRKGNQHLKTALITAAVAASRKTGSYLKDKYFHLRARRGPLRAAVAVGRKILIAAYHMLATGAGFQDLGADHLDKTHRRHTIRTLLRRLNRLGYQVALRPLPAGA